MKKLFTLLIVAASSFAVAKAQIVISGFMFDPKGADAPALGSAAAGSGYVYKGGFEYVQLLATQDIDFAVTPYYLLRCVNTGSSNGAPTGGWSSTDGARILRFKLNTGTVSRGQYFYVGGPEKVAAGYLNDELGNVYYPTLDLSASKWIRTIAYNLGGTSTIGDDGVGVETTGFWNNKTPLDGSGANPYGLAIMPAVFDGTTVPIDAFFMYYKPASLTSGSKIAVYKDLGGGNINGYLVPANDITLAGYIADGPNDTKFIGYEPSADKGWFLKLGGVYNTNTNSWTTPRGSNYVQLVPDGGTFSERIAFATLSMLEGTSAGAENIGGTALATKLFPETLPVSLTSFTSKKQASSVAFSWETASEQNNAYFNVQRSTDGRNYETVAKVKGNGTSISPNKYHANDLSPAAGNNYYRLTQTDFDGRTEVVANCVVNFELQKSLSLQVMQNGGYAKCKVTSDKSGLASVTISDLQGRRVSSFSTKVNVGANTISDSKKLSPGIYVVTLQLANQQLAEKLVVR